MDTSSTIQIGISSYTQLLLVSLSFVAIFCFFTDLVDSCSSCALLSVSLNSAIVRIQPHVSVILQSHVTSIYFSRPVIIASRAR